MPIYQAPIRDCRFLLEEVLRIERFANHPRFANAGAEVSAAIIEEAGRFASEVLHPINQRGDAEGCTWNSDGSVTTPAGFREAYAAFTAGAWGTLTAPAEHGGQDLPHVLGFIADEFWGSANLAFSLYPMLASGATTALMVSGTAEQQATYLPKLVSGEWTGTMNLTEPHSGTDLGMIRTRAEPQGDGSYRITGTKIFISAGEHDLAENIVHLVLAKLPDAPASTKGISLFLVPKRLPGPDGTLGPRNAVRCGGIEQKMGIHGNATCTMNYDGATGWLVGEANRGLAAMFVMMNAARLGVGVQGLSQAEVAYQNGVAYARDRRQGRASVPSPEGAGGPDPIIVHPDVRRLLMDARALTEGLRALCLWGALLVDLAGGEGDKEADGGEEGEVAADLLGFLTPVIKAYGTDIGFKVATEMQQVWGGHGYIAENGMEQFVRDARITQIYEGTNGIQALDLVGRKMPANGGRALRSFLALVREEIAQASGDGAAATVADRLGKATGELETAAGWLLRHAAADRDNAGAAAYHIMTLTGLVALGLMWLRMARAAQEALAGGGAADERAFYEAKLITARHFAQTILPDAGALRRRIEAGAETLMILPAESFALR